MKISNLALGATLSAILLLSGVSASAQDVDWSLNTSINSSYLVKGGQVSDKPVVNASAFGKSGDITFGVWAQKGFEDKGDEVDLSAHYDFGGIKAGVTTYSFPGSGELVDVVNPELLTKLGEVSLKAQYALAPKGEDGYIFSASAPVYKKDAFAVSAAVHGGKTFFSGKDFVSFDASFSYKLTDSVSLKSLVRHYEGGNTPGTKFLVGISANPADLF